MSVHSIRHYINMRKNMELSQDQEMRYVAMVNCLEQKPTLVQKLHCNL